MDNGHIDGNTIYVMRSTIEQTLARSPLLDEAGILGLEVDINRFYNARGKNEDIAPAVKVKTADAAYAVISTDMRGSWVSDGRTLHRFPMSRDDIAKAISAEMIDEMTPHPLSSRLHAPFDQIIVSGSYMGPDRRDYSRRAEAHSSAK